MSATAEKTTADQQAEDAMNGKKNGKPKTEAKVATDGKTEATAKSTTGPGSGRPDIAQINRARAEERAAQRKSLMDELSDVEAKLTAHASLFPNKGDQKRAGRLALAVKQFRESTSS